MKATALLAVLLLAGIAWLAPRVFVEDPYRMAERYYEAGDFERSALWCERALRRSPGNAAAKALFMEVQFILGQGKAYQGWPAYDEFMVYKFDPSQALVEIDNAFARAERADDPEAAKREWRKILEYAKWLPIGVETQSRADRARAYLECVSGPAASAR